MPQLDSNAFIYQYVGIIVLLISVYFILSYIVLPILLRLILIRDLFLNTRQTVTELTGVVSNNYQLLVNFKNPCRGFNLINSFLFNSASVLNSWLNVVTLTLFKTEAETKSIDNVMPLIYNNVTNYLILFLLIESEENE